LYGRTVVECGDDSSIASVSLILLRPETKAEVNMLYKTHAKLNFQRLFVMCERPSSVTRNLDQE
jgi:hypothetical protein